MAPPQAAWRRATPADVADINRVEAQVHTLLPERPEVFVEKMTLFGEGCLVLADATGIVGYGVCYPWIVGEVPALDTFLQALPPEADCLFIHDVALLPAVRALGYGGAYVRHAIGLARARGLSKLALVSVYGTTPVWGRCGFAIEAPRPTPKMEHYGETARYMVADLERVAV